MGWGRCIANALSPTISGGDDHDDAAQGTIDWWKGTLPAFTNGTPLRYKIGCFKQQGDGSWQVVFPNDGIADSDTEQYTLKLENLTPGEHQLLIRVVDSVGNLGAATTKVVAQ